MDDLSEKEQLERIREWWRENGWYIAAGIALGVLLLVGWNQYNDWQERRLQEAAALYEDLRVAAQRDDVTEAGNLLAALRDRHVSSPYTDQAGLLMGRLLFRLNRPEPAADELRYVMQNSGDPDLALVARLRLARVLAHQDAHAEALALLRVSEPGEFAARFSELRGDMHVALGEHEAARGAYMQAMIQPGSDLLDRTLLQMKLNDLPPSGETGL